MKRRDFLKGLSAAALLMPATSMAEIPTPEAMKEAKTKISEAITRAFEFESADLEHIEWIDGFSDGSGCTFFDDDID